ncbi:MAG: phosphotransferase, partial [Actinomycetota bacterium]
MQHLIALLAPWMPAQRWFAGKLREPELEIIGGYALDTGAPDVGCRVVLVLDRAIPPALYQVPVTERVGPLDDAGSALIGRAGDRWIYDGAHDPAFAAALLRLMLDEGAAHSDDGTARIAAFGHSDTTEDLKVATSRVLGGEQSNTSIIIDTTDAHGRHATPVICKIFRTIHHGENPDVVLTGALGAAGSRVVPRSIGHVTGRWPDSAEPDGLASGHLAFAQEFLPGVEDAWRVALAAADAGEDFGERARQLGEATAQMHLALASVLPSRVTTADDVAAIIAGMRSRLELAMSELPQLERHRNELDAVYAIAATVAWPPLQRVHGDFHLGQVLSVR